MGFLRNYLSVETNDIPFDGMIPFDQRLNHRSMGRYWEFHRRIKEFDLRLETTVE